jgi:Holliday junction resolvasome RuvABC endonuclease subunit
MKVFQGKPIAENEPVYLGIDQSYGGFAITAYKDHESYYTEVYKSDLRGVDRLRDIQAHVMNWLHEFNNIQDVAMEGYAFGSQMANMLGELGGMVKLTLRDFGIYPLIVPPTNLKKYTCGKGAGVSKSQMLLHVYKNWGVEFTDDNAADSYALAHLVSGSYTRAYEKEVYEKLKDPKFRER